MKPIIGMTGMRQKHSSNLPGPPLQGVYLSDDYAHAIEEAGGLPLVIPFLKKIDNIQEFANRIDGLLLSGGVDVDPAIFGEEPRLGLGTVIPERDWLDIELLKAVHAQGKPVLGICRGMQVMNIALGGTIYQDLAHEWNGTVQHSQRAPRGHLSHTVHIKPNSQLYGLLGDTDKMRVNSFHHQSVKNIAPNMEAVAWDDEGLAEAIEYTGDSFCLAVQWHPENLWRNHRQFLGLFRGLVKEAAVFRGHF
ncbi:putative glutamine amidotransferase [Scopulibacillus daqui]|uniref:Glutamine amidotransferase n=1 Tax=Scopulibacillus daqui TaxID=1469162 RepID=A0ABS2Q2X8_9BACL|nr:gamma-glutamyl-gamma-aminobutyrate hydrolase family protein [Scopulibacillus daqui]MBM7646649.1 putative glutamine amidotransferase [Scopulibacillus daqui]